eukprot:5097407-Amphidinium_carterae.1
MARHLSTHRASLLVSYAPFGLQYYLPLLHAHNQLRHTNLSDHHIITRRHVRFTKTAHEQPCLQPQSYPAAPEAALVPPTTTITALHTLSDSAWQCNPSAL